MKATIGGFGRDEAVEAAVGGQQADFLVGALARVADLEAGDRRTSWSGESPVNYLSRVANARLESVVCLTGSRSNIDRQSQPKRT
jgi:hypothetical protein